MHRTKPPIRFRDSSLAPMLLPLEELQLAARLTPIPMESGWCFFEHNRDGKRIRWTLTSWNGRAYLRVQPWFTRTLGGPWISEKGQGMSICLVDLPGLICGLEALQTALPGFDPIKDGAPCSQLKKKV